MIKEGGMAGKGFDVAIKVVSQRGKCRHKHYVGEEWLFNGKSPGGICFSALVAMIPMMSAVRYTGEAVAWTKDDPDIAQAACPDSKNPVVFEIRRIRK